MESNEDLLCTFCVVEEENADHVFLSCKTIEAIWKFFLAGVSMVTVLPSNIEQHFFQHVLPMGLSKANIMWKYILVCYYLGDLELTETSVYSKIFEYLGMTSFTKFCFTAGLG